MTLWIFLIILTVLAWIDYLSFKIPNIIVLPAIGYGVYLTGNWLAAIVMFAMGAVLYKTEFWRGGDVKLMMMIGAFMGLWGALVLFWTIVTIISFRRIFNFNKALPVTPFSLAAALPFVLWIR